MVAAARGPVLRRGGPSPANDVDLMDILQQLLRELAITIANVDVWLSIGLALLLGGGCLAFGTWVARTVGLLKVDAPAGETVGVGLASGLLVLAAWWAAIWSGGRSSFTPVAVGFAVAIALALASRARRSRRSGSTGDDSVAGPRSSSGYWRRSHIIALGASACFLVGIALLYGSTMAPSPRDGVQPVEFNDEAFYSVLGRDLAITGTETNLTASGFAELPDLPSQAWYHWGEMWLASAVVKFFATAPIAARYFVVLPLILLASAALTGTLVRQMSKSTSRAAYLFGFASCLVLAPVPMPGTFFSSWAAGLVFGVNLYGLVVVAVLLAIYSWAAVGTIRPTWTLACFVGSLVAFIFPAHLVIAVLAAVGVGAGLIIQLVRSALSTGQLPVMQTIRHRGLITAGVLLLGTIAWGLFTGHGVSGSAPSPSSITPFNGTWAHSVALTYLGAGCLLALPVAALHFRNSRPFVAGMCLGTCAIVTGGAILWGARLSDFNMFHAFFGAIAVFGGRPEQSLSGRSSNVSATCGTCPWPLVSRLSLESNSRSVSWARSSAFRCSGRRRTSRRFPPTSSRQSGRFPLTQGWHIRVRPWTSPVSPSRTPQHRRTHGSSSHPDVL